MSESQTAGFSASRDHEQTPRQFGPVQGDLGDLGRAPKWKQSGAHHQFQVELSPHHRRDGIDADEKKQHRRGEESLGAWIRQHQEPTPGRARGATSCAGVIQTALRRKEKTWRDSRLRSQVEAAPSSLGEDSTHAKNKKKRVTQAALHVQWKNKVTGHHRTGFVRQPDEALHSAQRD